MKVNGPGAQPPEAPGKLDDVDKGGKADKAGGKADVSGKSFAETLGAGRPAPSAAQGASPADPLTSDITAELKAGKIDAKTALDRVVERVLDRQLGANAPADVRDRLRDALRDTISSDPFLAERLRGLG
jgi:hypothetical protein